jgi:hypothetical protein
LKEATAKEFDGHFEYRFSWKLRNYGHIDFPALALNIQQSAPIGKPPQMKADVRLRRDVLLENFDDWGAIVRADLEGQAEEFSVVPILTTVMESLDRIKAVVGVIEYPDLVEAVKVLDEMRDRTPDEPGSPTLIRLEIDQEGKPRHAHMISIPPFQLPEEPPERMPGASSESPGDESTGSGA